MLDILKGIFLGLCFVVPVMLWAFKIIQGFTMKKLYIARGYNSFTNTELVKAFSTEKDADSFIDGLTDPHIQVISYKSTIQLMNYFLNKAKQ